MFGSNIPEMRMEFTKFPVRDLKRSPSVWKNYLMNCVTNRIVDKEGENMPSMESFD